MACRTTTIGTDGVGDVVRRCLILLFPLLLVACTPSKESADVPEPTIEELIASIPPIELSDDAQVYSLDGDMRASVPVGWVTLDPLAFDNPDIFAVACDDDYSMALVFARIPIERDLGQRYRTGGMPVLVRDHIAQRNDRIGFDLVDVSEAGEIAIGRKKFGRYRYTTDDGRTLSYVALFATGSNIYECTVTQLPLTEADLPDADRLDRIHRIILGGIVW